jgi:hypothetical protein
MITGSGDERRCAGAVGCCRGSTGALWFYDGPGSAQPVSDRARESIPVRDRRGRRCRSVRTMAGMGATVGRRMPIAWVRRNRHPGMTELQCERLSAVRHETKRHERTGDHRHQHDGREPTTHAQPMPIHRGPLHSEHGALGFRGLTSAKHRPGTHYVGSRGWPPVSRPAGRRERRGNPPTPVPSLSSLRN